MKEQSKVDPKHRKFWCRNNFARGFATLGVVACVATGTWAVEESAKLGLRGILPTSAPPELAAEEFAKLDGNWAEWSKGAAQAVADFYAKLESADVAGQRSALNVLKNKLDVMQRAIDDPRYKSILSPLTLMHARLAQRVDFADAVLKTLEADPAQYRAARVAESSRQLTAAINGLKSNLSGIANGQLWIPYVKADAVQTALGAGGEAAITAVRDAKARTAGRQGLSDQKQKEFLGRPAFLKYEAALDQYLAVATAEPFVANEAELRNQIKALLEAADSFAETRSSDDAAKARAAYLQISKLAPDGGDALADVLQKHNFNYNIRLFASEAFLNRVMGESRTERGPVVDFILGANVSGNQTTATKVAVDLRPSGRTFRFDVVLNGNINSSTVGVTSEATVYTQGNHTFVARKEVQFDGVAFTTLPATIHVNPHNTTTGVATRMSGGLFGGIADNIASQEVEARRGQAEAIAASRVRDRVLPKFNQEADKNFGEAGPKMEKEVFSGLKATGLYPDAFIYQTTDSTLRLSTRLMGAAELGADLPSIPPAAGSGAALLMHETAVNNAIDRMELGGQTLTEPQLREKMEAFFTKALSRPVKLDPPPKPAAAVAANGEKAEEEDDGGPSAIIFAKTDPMRIRFENGEMVLMIRAGFKQEGKDDIPTREITVPMTFEVKGPKINITRGAVRVVAASGEGGGIAINGIVRKKIQNSLPDRAVDTKVELKGPKTTVVANISDIKLADGWVSVTVD